MSYRSFPEMIRALRAGQASGMDCTIKLKPDAAGFLADVLEEYRDHHAAVIRGELEHEKREMALQVIASEGQAHEAYEARKAAESRVEALESAIARIAPYLSASLTHKPYGLGDDAGPGYRAACEAIFAVDRAALKDGGGDA